MSGMGRGPSVIRISPVRRTSSIVRSMWTGGRPSASASSVGVSGMLTNQSRATASSRGERRHGARVVSGS